MQSKEHFLTTILQGAKAYSKLVDKKYKVESADFLYQKEYTISFHTNNFLHLTGVQTKLRPNEFYKRALTGILSEADFEVESKTNPELLNHIKMKMKNIMNLGEIVEATISVEERMRRGKIECKIATTDGKFTLCFTGNKILSPMSLLYGNLLHKSKAVDNLAFIEEQKTKTF